MAPPHDLPVIDVDRLNQIFSDLGSMEVVLDPDPLEFGPKRMNGKVARARTLLSQCERIFLQVSHDLQLYKRMHRSAQLAFDLQMQDLLANDPETRSGRNVRDRDAIATMKMRPEREHLMTLEVTIQDLEMVLTVIKAKRADMRDIQVRLAQQQKLCEAEIGIGGKWGSKPPPGVNTPDLDASPMMDHSALDQIQELLDSEAGEIHLEAGDGGWLTRDGPTVSVDWVDPDSTDNGQIAVPEEEVSLETIGWCGVAGCGEPVYVTSSGTVCHGGHGGAPVLRADPALVEPEPVAATGDTAVDETVDFDFADLFDDNEVQPATAVMPAVTTDANVDALFERMVERPAPKPKAVPVAEEDIDALIDMFSA